MRRFLVVYWHPEGTGMRHAVERHLHALDGGDDQVVYLNAFPPPPRSLRGATFDAVLLHTTFLCMRWADFFEEFRPRWEWLAQLDAVKCALPQDEYDHSEILDEWLEQLGVTRVFTNFPNDSSGRLYERLRSQASFRGALTGYIDEEAAELCARRMRPLEDRPNDLVYRATKLPYWFGSHGQLKHRLAEVFAERAPAHGLRTDISTRFEDTIFGDAWFDFLMSGRAVIGCESGSSVLDPRGEIQTKIRGMLAARPQLTFDEAAAQLPPGWDSYAFFAISPRHLEAVITKTCQVLVEGGYSGVLEAGRHYLPLRRDLSNLEDVLEQLRDRALVEELAERAYQEVYLPGRFSYGAFAAQVRAELGAPRQVGSATRILSPALIALGRREERARKAVRSRTGSLRAVRPARAGFAATPPTLALRLNVARVVAGVLRENRPLRRLSLRYAFGRLWRDVPPRALARDLLRIGLLRSARARTASGSTSWRTRIVEDGARLTVWSERADSGSADAPFRNGRGAGEIVWDHSTVAAPVPLFPDRPAAGAIEVGPNHVHEFVALESLAARYPDLVRGALLAAVGGADVARGSES